MKATALISTSEGLPVRQVPLSGSSIGGTYQSSFHPSRDGSTLMVEWYHQTERWVVFM